MRSFRGPPLAGVVAFLAACAAIPPETLPPGSFALVGRVAVRYGDEAASGRLTWRHSGVADELRISTPLGQGVAVAALPNARVRELLVELVRDRVLSATADGYRSRPKLVPRPRSG